MIIRKRDDGLGMDVGGFRPGEKWADVAEVFVLVMSNGDEWAVYDREGMLDLVPRSKDEVLMVAGPRKSLSRGSVQVVQQGGSKRW